MEYVIKPTGANNAEIRKIEKRFDVSLPDEFFAWWAHSNGADIYFGFKELQFFSVTEIVQDTPFNLAHYMPHAIPICMDGNGNICVAKVEQRHIVAYYLASCGSLGWDNAKYIASSLTELINAPSAPETLLYS
ncbi:hypothetical protein NFHSH190041_08320 [Shewanella sp. NFH-SH190041]|uniref:SMI1/KNR4 family protein n=1 Tax=Shewanella sp. NFH-SH190041 TaxID=2950245 RepID=UPI0021C438C3|nr:SMI1/KNR4 family protein [Shewanella sp. NFH-SH190041]BDM63380.1 hypothetical protein NFHSH190041_08320 [Shewanella sp. NFH-SH190041]